MLESLDMMPIGCDMYDAWTHQNVTIVAGAQGDGYVTVRFYDDTVTVVQVSDLR